MVFLGFCKDIRDEIESTNIFLSPIPFGTGIKTKIIEAMAMGMPVITNDIGIEGISCLNGINVIIENNYQNMAKVINSLINDEGELSKLGIEAQKNINYNYCLDNVKNKLDLILKSK